MPQASRGLQESYKTIPTPKAPVADYEGYTKRMRGKFYRKNQATKRQAKRRTKR
jgi:hypothetical protein